jgi:hypothetical protein
LYAEVVTCSDTSFIQHALSFNHLFWDSCIVAGRWLMGEAVSDSMELLSGELQPRPVFISTPLQELYLLPVRACD